MDAFMQVSIYVQMNNYWLVW